MPPTTLREFFAADDYYTDADSNAYAMPTFVGNHDMGRIGYFLQRVNQAAADDAELLARSKLAHALMYFARGQPVIYYGDEQGFTGDGGDKLARQDMFANTVPDYDDDDLIGTDATTSDDNFDPTHPIYQALADYAAAYTAHQRCAPERRSIGPQSARPGIYAFSRIDRVEKVEYLVAFNNAEAETARTLPTYYDAGTQFDLVISEGPAPATLVTDAAGDVTMTVAPLGFAVYRASTPIPVGTETPGIAITSLTNGQEVPLDVENLDGHDVVQRVEVVADLDDRHVRRSDLRRPASTAAPTNPSVPTTTLRIASSTTPPDCPRWSDGVVQSNRRRPVGKPQRRQGHGRAAGHRGATASDRRRRALRGDPLPPHRRRLRRPHHRRLQRLSGASTCGATSTESHRMDRTRSRSSARTSTDVSPG